MPARFFPQFADDRRGPLEAGAGGSQLAFAGAVGGSICAIAIPLADVAGAINKNEISPATAGTFHHIGDAFFVGAELVAVLLFAATALLSFTTGAFPRWWAALMVLVAVVLIVGPIGWAGLIFGVPVWTLVTAAMLLRRAPEPRSLAAAAASS